MLMVVAAAFLLRYLFSRASSFSSSGAMAHHQQLQASAVPAPGELNIDDIMGLIDGDDHTEGVPPSEPVVAVAEQHSQALKRAKEELSDADEVGASAPKSARIKAEVVDAGVPPAGALAFSPSKVKPPQSGPLRAGSSGSLGVSPSGKSSKGDIAESVCEGCGRTRGVSPCFLICGESCAWAYADGKGLWCRECFNCHRTNFATSTGLSYFAAWLQKSQTNRLCWERTLLAHISLQLESGGKITQPLVAERLRLMSWLWQVVEHDPLEFVGVTPTASFIRKWLRKIAGVPPAEIVKSEEDSSIVGVPPTIAKSALGKRIDGIIPQAEALLVRFSDSNWVEMHAAQFNKVVVTLSSLWTQCGQACESDETTLLVARWCEGAQAGHMFVKACGYSGGADSGRGRGIAAVASAAVAIAAAAVAQTQQQEQQ